MKNEPSTEVCNTYFLNYLTLICEITKVILIFGFTVVSVVGVMKHQLR